MLKVIVLRERLQRVHLIDADAHDLGIGGFELWEVHLKAADLGRSGRGNGLNERIDHHWALPQEIGQLHLLSAGSG